MVGCSWAWCGVVNSFNALFDTNDPAKMQEAVNRYSQWPREDMGIAVAVTKDHYYEMYHGNVQAKLSEYLPKGLFSWSFGEKYKVFQEPTPENGMQAVLLREGKMTLSMGWFQRNMFWHAVVKATAHGETFPEDTVEDFDDCKNCGAALSYTLKKGGLSGAGEDWVIVGLAVVKLA